MTTIIEPIYNTDETPRSTVRLPPTGSYPEYFHRVSITVELSQAKMVDRITISKI